MYLGIPAGLIVAMNYFTVDVTIPGGSSGGDDSDGSGGEEEETAVKAANPAVVLSLFAYIILVVSYGYVKKKRMRLAILIRLDTERARERGEEVDLLAARSILGHNYLDNIRAHCCCAFCYQHDYDFYDDSTGMVFRDGLEGAAVEQPEADVCTRLWDCLSRTFWCCGCWCQCCGICAVAQEEREVNRLTGNEQQKIDYITFQPYSEYYPSIQNLVEHKIRSPWKHIQSISILSSKLLKNVVAVLVVLLVYSLAKIDSNFTWVNMIVLFLTLGQAFFIEYLVHWKWNLFDLSFDSVVKYFACGFFLTTPSAVVFEMIISTFASVVAVIVGGFVLASDSQLAKDFESDPKLALQEFMVKYPALFIIYEFVNAFIVAAVVEEMVKYFGYRMVVTPDLLPGRSAPSSRNENDEETAAVGGGSSAKSARSTGAGITVAMVSVALGFACCENLMYIFVYSPPSLGVEIWTLLARSLFPVHPLCAAIQSIGVCKRDLEGDKKYGLGRIILPAILLHGSFDFVLMVVAYFMQVNTIQEGTGDDATATPDNEDGATEDISEQLPSMFIVFAFVIVGYTYYVVQSRAQNRRLIAMDNASASREQNTPLV